MKDEDLILENPYGIKTSFLTVTERLRTTLDASTLAYAKHKLANPGFEHQPSDLGIQEQGSAVKKCQICRDVKLQIAYLQEQLTTIRVDFMIETLRRQDRQKQK